MGSLSWLSNLYWQARPRQVDTTRPRSAQGHSEIAKARTLARVGALLGRERNADRIGKHRQGRDAPTAQEPRSDSRASPRGAESLHLGHNQQRRAEPAIMHSESHAQPKVAARRASTAYGCLHPAEGWAAEGGRQGEKRTRLTSGFFCSRPAGSCCCPKLCTDAAAAASVGLYHPPLGCPAGHWLTKPFVFSPFHTCISATDGR